MNISFFNFINIGTVLIAFPFMKEFLPRIAFPRFLKWVSVRVRV